MKVLSGFHVPERDEYKEASVERIKNDESAVQKIISVVEERMLNPFEVDIGASVDDKLPLVNIATSGVASPEIQNDISKAREMGQIRLQDCRITELSSWHQFLNKPSEYSAL